MSLSSKMTVALAASLTLSAAAWSTNANACSGTDPIIASVCIFAGNFEPRGFAFTDGRLMPISQNTALFALIGTIYGGNGQTNFALPDTRGRVVIGVGQGPNLSNYVEGQTGGAESATLTVSNLPPHNHTASTTAAARGSSTTGNADGPGGNTWAAKPRGAQYSSVAPDVNMNAGNIVASTSVGTTGGGQAFSIVQPYVAMNYLIVLQGIFPSRN